MGARAEDHDEDHDRGADDVPPHRDVVDDTEDRRLEQVQDRHQDHQDDEPEELLLDVVAAEERPGVAVVEQADRGVEEERRTVDDRGDDAQQADQVEPPRVEAGARSAELRGPPVDAGRGRVGGDELRHAEADEHDEGREDQPAPRDRDRAAVVPAGTEGREAAGQDRDPLLRKVCRHRSGAGPRHARTSVSDMRT